MSTVGSRDQHVAVWRQAFSQSISRELQFRSQAVATIVVGLLSLVISVLPVLLLFTFTPEVKGWTAGQAIALVGVYQVMASLLATFITPNLTRMHSYVTRGDLDQVLIRPVSSQLYITARWFSPAELIGVGSGLVVVVVGLFEAGVAPSPLDALFALAWFAIGLLLVICLWSNLAYLEFWFQAANPVADLIYDLLGAGRYPTAFFPPGGAGRVDGGGAGRGRDDCSGTRAHRRVRRRLAPARGRWARRCGGVDPAALERGAAQVLQRQLVRAIGRAVSVSSPQASGSPRAGCRGGLTAGWHRGRRVT